MIEIEIGCTFEFQANQRTHAVVMVEPHFAESGRVVSSRFDLIPHDGSLVYLDHFGNSCRRMDLAAGRVTMEYSAIVSAVDGPDPIVTSADEVAPCDLPDEALMFVLPSRFCESDLIADVAFATFGGVTPGWQRVQAISDWVHDSLAFQYGSSSPSLSAMDVLAAGTGVCRDYAHLAIALCRALNIPARYVFGYLPDIGVPDPGTPMDFCAWIEVYLGDDWHTFDPRNNQRRIGRVVIGRGRDAADVAMVTSFGMVDLLDMTVVAELSSRTSG